MNKIQEGRLYQRLKEKEINVKEFLKKYSVGTSHGLSNFREVSANELREHKEHELAHAQVYDELKINYKFYLSHDGKDSATVPNSEAFNKHASKLSHDEFIELLIKIHNPPNAVNFRMGKTDFMVYKILTGNFSDQDIEDYAVANFAKWK